MDGVAAGAGTTSTSTTTIPSLTRVTGSMAGTGPRSCRVVAALVVWAELVASAVQVASEGSAVRVALAALGEQVEWAELVSLAGLAE